LIAPVSLVWGLFNPSIRVYEPVNTGWWYDFGFYIAIIGGFGGFALMRRRPREIEQEGELPPPSSHTTGHTVPYHGGS